MCFEIHICNKSIVLEIPPIHLAWADCWDPTLSLIYGNVIESDRLDLTLLNLAWTEANYRYWDLTGANKTPTLMYEHYISLKHGSDF